jgi:hypothetical protein
MTMTQIAMLLEISGFIIAGVFAGILLERGTIGKLAEKVDNWIKSTADTLDKGFPPPPPQALKGATFYSIFSMLLWMSIVVIIVGWLNNLRYLVIFGLIWILAFHIEAPILIIPSKNRRKIAKSFAKVELILWVTIPLLMFTAGITLLRLTLKWLAGKDMLKKAFLVFGTVMLLAGLILEFVATL